MRSVLRLLLQLFLIMALIIAPNNAPVAAQSAGVVTVSPSTGASGSIVTVSGSGYRPGERVNIRWAAANGTLVGYVNAKPDGRFTGKITVPVANLGSYSIYGVGATSNITGSGVFRITSNTPGTTVRVTPTEGLAGSIVTVSGTGMQSGERVNLRWGSATGTLIGYVTAKNNGTFSGRVTIPTVAAGTYVISADGATSKRIAQTDFVVQEPPPATLTVNPASAPAGTIVTVSGTGMQPGERVNIHWGSATGTLLGFVTATSTGTFSGQVTIPTVAAGTYAIFANGATSLRTAQTNFVVQEPPPATVTVNPSSAPAGTVVTVSGTGMQPDERVNIRWGSATGTLLGFVTATSTGTYNGQVTIPTVTAGSYVISADGATSNRTAQTDFVVEEPATLAVNPSSAPAGTIVTVSGTGMQPGERVNIRWGSATGTLLGFVTATNTGTYSGAVTIPTVAAGTYVISADGSTSLRTAQADFVVEEPPPATLTVNPASAPAGTVVTLSGTGMQPGERVNLRWGSATGTLLGFVTATSTGTYNGQVTIPTVTAGSYVISADGATSNRTAQTDFTVEASATLTVNPASGPAGSVVAITGTGMQPGEVVTLRWGSATGSSLGTVTATSTGTYSGQVTIPTTAAAGTYAIVANGATSNRTAQTDFVVQEPVTIAVNPASAPAGTVVNVSGTGMQPGERVNIRWGSATGTLLGFVTATSTGTYSGQVTIPTVAAGTYVIFAEGATSNRTAQTEFVVQPPSTLNLNPDSGPAGSVITVSGTGMQPGEIVNIRWGSAAGTVLVNVTATSTGTYSGQVTVPTVAAGTYAIFATGATSNRTAQADFTVEAPPTLTVNPDSAPAGSVVAITGTGMQPGERVDIRWGSSTGTLLGFVSATSTGTYSGQVTIPTVAVGTYAIVANGTTSDRSAQAEFVVQPPPTLTVNPNSGPAGSVVTLTGTGMQPGERVNLRWGSATGTLLGFVTATSTGTFSGSVTIPTVAAGTYAIFADGATSNRTAQTDFVVEAPAPATVTVNPSSAPAGTVVNVSGTGMQPGERVNIRWGSATGTLLGFVTATSTGTYNGQVTIPTVAAGTYAISADGATSLRTAQTDFVVQAPTVPTLTVTPSSGPAGIIVTVSGTGMQPGERVNILWASATGSVLDDVTATSTGTFSGQVTIPERVANTYRIHAEGVTSKRTAQTNFTIEASAIPTLTVNPSSAPAGTEVYVSGAGMQPGESVNIRWGSATGPLVGSATATSTGTFSSSPVTVPTTASAGSYVIFSDGTTSGRTAQTDFIVQRSTSATLTVTPATARPAETLQVTGSGYGPGETVEIVWVWPNTVAGTITATSTGTLNGQIPMNTTGGPIKAVGRTTGATGQDSVEWTWWTPTLTTTTTTVSIGQVITFNGQGYLRNETVRIVTTRADGTHLELARVVATSTGTITGQITIPAMGGSYLPIDARGVTSDAWASLELTITGPTITLSPNEGVPGDIITLTGSGFTPGERVNAYRHHEGTTTTLVGSTDANPDGTVSMPITFPACSTSNECYSVVISATGASSQRSGSTMLWLDRSSEAAVNRTAATLAGTPAVVPTKTPAPTGTPAVLPTETPAATGIPAMVPTQTPAATGTPAIEEPTETPAPVVTPTETVVPTEVVLPSPTPEPTQAPAPLTYDHVFSIVDDAGTAVPGACVQLTRADGSLAGEWCDASIDGVNDGLYPATGLAEGGYTIRLTALPANVTFVQDQQLSIGSGMETSTVLYVKREPAVEPTPASTEMPVPTSAPTESPTAEPTQEPSPTPEPTVAPMGVPSPVPAGEEPPAG